MLNMFKSILIYLGGSVLSKLVVFFMLPIYTKYLPPNDYGYYDIVNTYVYLGITIIFMEVWVVVLRYMFDRKESEKCRTMSSGITLYFGCLILLCICTIICNIFLNVQYIGWVLLYACFQTISLMYGYMARAYNKGNVFAISGVISAIVNASINIMLIVVFSVDYKSLYISYIAGAVIQCIIIEWKVGVLRKYKFKYVSFQEIKEMIIFAIPFGISSTAYWFLSSFNRTVVSTKLSMAENGIYSVALKFTLVLNLVSSAFILAWQENSFKKASETKGDTSESLYSFYSFASDTFIKVISIAIILILPIISIVFPYIIDFKYIQGYTIIPLAIVATAINIYVSFLTSIFAAIKRTKLLLIDALIGSLVNIIVIYALIDYIGVNAASISLICGWLVSAIIRVQLLKKYINFKVNKKSIFIYCILILISSYIYLYCNKVINIIEILLICIGVTIIFYKEFKKIYIMLKMNIKEKVKIKAIN